MKTQVAYAVLLCSGLACLPAVALPAAARTEEDLTELIERIQVCVEDAHQTAASGEWSASTALTACAAKTDLRTQGNASIKTVVATKVVALVPTDDWSASERASFQDQAATVLEAAVTANPRYSLATPGLALSARYELTASIVYQSSGHGQRQVDQWITMPKQIQLVLEMRDVLGFSTPRKLEMTVQISPQIRPRNSSIRNSNWFFKASDLLRTASVQLLDQHKDNPRLAALQRSANGKLQANSASYLNISPAAWMVLVPDTFDASGPAWQLARPSPAQRFSSHQSELQVDPVNGDTRQCAESTCLVWIP
jgi:hypothetical protein